MAVDFAGIDYKRGSIYRFRPTDIKIIPNLCARHEPPNEAKIKWLQEQFLNPAIGQIEPIVIRRDGKDSPPILIAGHRRWEAATRINVGKLTPAPFLLDCVYQDVNEAEGFKLAVQENIREATTPWDDAYNIRTLTKLCGMTPAEIAGLYGEEEAWVKSRLELTSLSEEGRDALRDGTLKVTAAVKLAKLSAEQQRKALKDAKTKGVRITGAAIQQASGKPQKPGFKELRGLLQQVVDEGKIPATLSFKLDPKNEGMDTLAEFCQSILDYLGAKS